MVKVRLNQKFAAWTMKKANVLDKKFYFEKKRELFSQIKENKIVLEIGPGAGINLDYYPKDIKWIGVEPNPQMREYLRDKANRLGFRVKILSSSSENLPLKSNSIDFVVSTLVLCSVKNIDKVLSEVKRVLKNGGRYLFLEHVADERGTFRRKIQNFAVHTPYLYFSNGCHPNRETWKFIEKEFKKVRLKKFYLGGRGPFKYIGKPHIYGVAVK